MTNDIIQTLAEAARKATIAHSLQNVTTKDAFTRMMKGLEREVLLPALTIEMMQQYLREIETDQR